MTYLLAPPLGRVLNSPEPKRSLYVYLPGHPPGADAVAHGAGRRVRGQGGDDHAGDADHGHPERVADVDLRGVDDAEDVDQPDGEGERHGVPSIGQGGDATTEERAQHCCSKCSMFVLN